MTIKIAQDSKQTRPEYWRWSATIEGTEQELDAVQQVTWLLHPTFVNPVRTSTSRATKFRLETAGWGEFQLKAKVKLKTGKVQNLSHWVKLERTLPAAPKSSVVSSEKDKVPPPRFSTFVSYTRDSVMLMREVTKALNDCGIDPSIDADVPSGVEFRRWVTEEISASDAVVALISNNIDVWQESEIKLGLATKKPLFMISAGPLNSETRDLVSSYKGSNIHSFIDSHMNQTKLNVQELAATIERLMRVRTKSAQ